MHVKHLALVPLLCAALLLSACGEAAEPSEELLSTQSLSADLDGDGQEETVEYSVISRDGALGSHCRLSIDGVSVDESLAEQGFNAVNVHAECAAVDIDASDGYIELAVLEDGQSADYYTNFIRFDGEGAVYLGRVPGLIGDTGYFPVTVNGDGSVTASILSGVLQNWSFSADYVLTDSGLELVEQDFYTDERYKTADKETLIDIFAYDAPDGGAERQVIKAGTVLSLYGEGGSWDADEGEHGAWALAEDASGAQYYLKVRELSEIEDAAGAWVEATDAISGLSLHG